MKNVLLVFGGRSYEHDISIVTAFQIYKKARLDDVNLHLLYISREGDYFLCDGSKVSINDFAKKNFNVRKRGVREVVFISGEDGKLFAKTRFGLKEILFAEVAIFACHGGDGENGKLVSFFENHGIACSSGSSNALAVCMDKFLFKSVAKGLNIPVVAGFKLSKFEFENAKKTLARRLAQIGFPVIIKINSGGSSIGLFIAKTINEFLIKISEAFQFDDVVIVEKFINNTREFNIAILGDAQSFEISEIDEPIKSDEVLSFSDKYLRSNDKGKGQKGTVSLGFSNKKVDLPESLVTKMKKLANKIFNVFGLYGVVRIDFLYDTLSEKLYVCEVNAIPGSLAFYFFKKNRVVTNDLLHKLIEVAERNRRKNCIKTEFVVDILSEK